MHILHLEDDGPLREILKIALEAVDPDCNLKQFISSDEADKYIQSNHPKIDLYILDIRVPGSMNGMQLAEKIRAVDKAGAIVMTSAYGRPNESFLTANRCEWCTKPWHILETPQMLLKLAKESKLKKATAELKAVTVPAGEEPQTKKSTGEEPKAQVTTGEALLVKPSNGGQPQSNLPTSEQANSEKPQVTLPTSQQTKDEKPTA